MMERSFVKRAPSHFQMFALPGVMIVFIIMYGGPIWTESIFGYHPYFNWVLVELLKQPSLQIIVELFHLA